MFDRKRFNNSVGIRIQRFCPARSVTTCSSWLLSRLGELNWSLLILHGPYLYPSTAFCSVQAGLCSARLQMTLLSKKIHPPLWQLAGALAGVASDELVGEGHGVDGNRASTSHQANWWHANVCCCTVISVFMTQDLRRLIGVSVLPHWLAVNVVHPKEKAGWFSPND